MSFVVFVGMQGEEATGRYVIGLTDFRGLARVYDVDGRTMKKIEEVTKRETLLPPYTNSLTIREYRGVREILDRSGGKL